MSYLCRARLRDNARIETVAALLDGKGIHGTTTGDPAHQLVWSMYADSPERKRDFLYREEHRGQYIALGARPPEDRIGIFHIDGPKPFAPAIEPGTTLAFSLRANPVARRWILDKDGERTKTVKLSVVTLALDAAGTVRDKDERNAIAHRAIVEWLKRAGEGTGNAGHAAHVRAGAGFTLNASSVGTKRYRSESVQRAGGRFRKRMRFAVVDIDGELRVDDPARLVEAVHAGFGSARAFGCGLMLLRRCG